MSKSITNQSKLNESSYSLPSRIIYTYGGSCEAESIWQEFRAMVHNDEVVFHLEFQTFSLELNGEVIAGENTDTVEYAIEKFCSMVEITRTQFNNADIH